MYTLDVWYLYSLSLCLSVCLLSLTICSHFHPSQYLLFVFLFQSFAFLLSISFFFLSICTCLIHVWYLYSLSLYVSSTCLTTLLEPSRLSFFHYLLFVPFIVSTSLPKVIVYITIRPSSHYLVSVSTLLSLNLSLSFSFSRSVFA